MITKVPYGRELELGMKVEKALADWIVEMTERNMGPGCGSKHFNLLESTPKKPSLIKMLHMERIIVYKLFQFTFSDFPESMAPNDFLSES